MKLPFTVLHMLLSLLALPISIISGFQSSSLCSFSVSSKKFIQHEDSRPSTDGSIKRSSRSLLSKTHFKMTVQDDNQQRRRLLLQKIFFTSISSPASALLINNNVAHAGIDPTALKSLPVQGDESGAAQRLRQVEAIKRPSTDLENIPFQELPSGVKYREYREGKGDVVVQSGSKVAVEMTIRCKSFATANEPGGLKYFSTKDDTDFNELAWTIGSGAMSPALEEGMMGMRKNAIRRIEIPSTAAFAAKKANQLPLPTTKDGKRRFENLFKTDATLLFEVLVTRIK